MPKMHIILRDKTRDGWRRQLATAVGNRGVGVLFFDNIEQSALASHDNPDGLLAITILDRPRANQMSVYQEVFSDEKWNGVLIVCYSTGEIDECYPNREGTSVTAKPAQGLSGVMEQVLSHIPGQ